jgi:hypothetical protein
MSKWPERGRLPGGTVVAAGLVLLVAGGCTPQRSELRLALGAEPLPASVVELEFANCFYRATPGNDLYVVGEVLSADADVEPFAAWLDLHVYWQPRPGRTPANPTQTNAIVRWVVQRQAEVLLYRGTGFAYVVAGAQLG